ncbi:MAG: lipase family protein [Limisphaerales bacterium]
MKAAIPNQFDAQNAAVLCALAAGAYQSQISDFRFEISDADTDTRVVIYQNDTELIVAFRGTAGLRNWVTDLDARFKAESGCRVHAGFSAALDSVERQLLAAMAGTSKRIWLTGHSLGGALAMLFAWRISNFKSEISDSLAGVYTFGQPRVGDAGFRDLYDSRLKERTFRVVDGEDFITRIPWLLGAYRHCGTEIFYDSLGVARVSPPWWVKGMSDVFGTWSEWSREGRIALLADHHVCRYVALFKDGMSRTSRTDQTSLTDRTGRTKGRHGREGVCQSCTASQRT